MANSNVSWDGSTRARVGYAVWRFLPYIAVGVAYGGADISEKHIASGIDYHSRNTYLGWTPSIGLEFAITKNLPARNILTKLLAKKKPSLAQTTALRILTLLFRALNSVQVGNFNIKQRIYVN